MIKKSLVNNLVLITLLLGSCNQSTKKANSTDEKKRIADSVAEQNESHNSANSLDWAGMYKGTLPCADCQGLEIEITLNTNLTYLIKTRYSGKSDEVTEEKGSFTRNTAGNTIILTGVKNKPGQYFVGENKLIQLDMAGERITGNLADKYVLIKIQG